MMFRPPMLLYIAMVTVIVTVVARMMFNARPMSIYVDRVVVVTAQLVWHRLHVHGHLLLRPLLVSVTTVAMVTGLLLISKSHLV